MKIDIKLRKTTTTKEKKSEKMLEFGKAKY